MEHTQTSWIERHSTALILALLVAASALYIALRFQYRLGAFNDDALYVITASDLSNQTVKDIFPQVKPDFPLPGLPLLLAPAAKFISPDWVQLEWISIIVTLLNIFLLYMLARKWLTAGETILACALYAFNPTVARFSGILMPEPYYTTFLLGCLLLLRSLLESPTRLKAAVFGVLVGWGSLIRLEGIFLLFSMSAALIVFGRRRVFPGTIATSLVGWVVLLLAWTRLRDLSRLEYAGELSSLLVYWKTNLHEASRFGAEMVRVFVRTTTAHSFSSDAMIAGTFTAWLLLTVHGARLLWKRPLLRPELTCVGTLTVLCIPTYLFWHLIVPRYYLPLLAFAIILPIHGLINATRATTQRKAWSAAIFALLFINYLPVNGAAVYESLWARDPMKRPPWHTFKWIQENTPSNTRVCSIMAPSIALYTGRFSTSIIKPARNPEEFRYQLLKRRLNYLVDRKTNALTPGVGKTENPNLVWKRIRLWMKDHPEGFERVFVDQKELVSIYEVKPDDNFVAAYEKYIVAAHTYQRGKKTDAFAAANESISIYPKLGAALNLLGVIYICRNDAENAEKYLLKALQQRPKSIFVRFNLATLYHMKKQDNVALGYLEQGLLVSRILHDEDRFLVNFQNYKSAWTPTSGALFIDTPSS